MDMDSITPQALQKMCENILFLLTTTVDVMEPVSKLEKTICIEVHDLYIIYITMVILGDTKKLFMQ